MSDKERLEDIKEKYSEVTVLEYINDIEIVGVDMKDLVWLIQQAERVEKLEEERDEWKDTAQSYYMTNQELREQNKRYKRALEEISNADWNSEGLDAERELDKVTDVAFKALECDDD